MPNPHVVVTVPDNIYLHPEWFYSLPERVDCPDLVVSVELVGASDDPASCKVYVDSPKLYNRIVARVKKVVNDFYEFRFTAKSIPRIDFIRLKPARKKSRYGGKGVNKRGVTEKCHRPPPRRGSRRGRSGGLY